MNASKWAARMALLIRRFSSGAGSGNADARTSARRASRSNEEGSQLVEMAIVAPLLLMILTGGASFCMALYGLQQLSNATSSATQQLGAQAGLAQNGLTDPCATAVTTVTAALPSWTASKLTYTLWITDSSGTSHQYGATAGSSFSCTAGASYIGQNEPITLQVSYQFTWLPILNFSPSSPITATQTALME